MDNKRVRVTHSVDLNKVPKLILDLQREALNLLVAILEEATKAKDSSIGDYPYLIESIDPIRKSLGIVDANLKDAKDLMVGYLRTVTEFSGKIEDNNNGE